MSSEELMKLKRDYVLFKDNLEYMIKENTDAVSKLSGVDTLLKEGYALNDEAADVGYLSATINRLNETCSTFKRVLANVNSKINRLNKDIEVAVDKELAEKLAAAGGSNGSKM